MAVSPEGPVYSLVLNTELDSHLSQHRLLGAPAWPFLVDVYCLPENGLWPRRPEPSAPSTRKWKQTFWFVLTDHPTQGITDYQFPILLPHQSNNNCLAEFPGNKDKLFSNCHGHRQFMLIKVTPA